MSSELGRIVSSKPPIRSWAARVTPRVAPKMYGGYPDSRSQLTRPSVWGRPRKAIVHGSLSLSTSRRAPTTSCSRSAEVMASSQPAPTSSSSWQKARARPRASRAPMLHACAAPRSPEASATRSDGIRLLYSSTISRVRSDEPLSTTSSSHGSLEVWFASASSWRPIVRAPLRVRRMTVSAGTSVTASSAATAAQHERAAARGQQRRRDPDPAGELSAFLQHDLALVLPVLVVEVEGEEGGRGCLQHDACCKESQPEPDQAPFLPRNRVRQCPEKRRGDREQREEDGRPDQAPELKALVDS